MALLASGADAAVLWGIRKFMDIVSGEQSLPLWGWIAVMLALTVLRLVFLSLKIRISENWVAKASARVTGWFLHRLRCLNPRVFHTPDGERQVEAAYESTQVLQSNGAVLFQAVQAILQLAVFLPVLLYISWPLTLFLFLLVVPVVATLQRRLHKLGPAEENLLRDRSDFRGDLSLARRLFRQWSSPEERREISSGLLKSLRHLRDAGLSNAIRKNELSLIIEAVSVLAMVCVLAFCALLVNRGWMNGSDLVLFCSAVLLSYKPVKDCARVMPQFRSVSSAVDVLENFENLETRGTEPSEKNENDGLKVQNGSFAYSGSDRPVFEGLHLDWSRSKPVLVRGRNGVGKSTLLRLLSGLELWNRRDVPAPAGVIRRETSGYLAGSVFFVAQDLELPPRRLLRQLLDRLTPETASVIAPFSQVSNAENLLDKNGLSGGERSRVALLWALASDCRTVLLDEPFASIALADREPLLSAFLDVATARNKWVIVVSHDVLTPAMEERFDVVQFDESSCGADAEQNRDDPADENQTEMNGGGMA